MLGKEEGKEVRREDAGVNKNDFARMRSYSDEDDDGVCIVWRRKVWLDVLARMRSSKEEASKVLSAGEFGRGLRWGLLGVMLKVLARMRSSKEVLLSALSFAAGVIGTFFGTEEKEDEREALDWMRSSKASMALWCEDGEAWKAPGRDNVFELFLLFK
mmetsp:Transcript_504/g.801  ORF Transcript_504/g.801 Transcript_504/m.801 type:complete len:158 (-) Transcript_504:24-497(-)